MTFKNPPDAEIKELLEKAKTIAVVGLSDRAGRPSFGVARALQGFGYRIIPVNPTIEKALGVPAVAGLEDIKGAVDIVDVFRDPKHVPGIVDQCIELKMPALWLQEGVIDAEAAARAQRAGIFVVMNRCIYREHARLFD